MYSKYHMWTYSILWTHTAILKLWDFCLHASALIQYKKLKTHDRIKTRNPSFTHSFMTQCSLLHCLSSSPFPVLLTTQLCIYLHMYMYMVQARTHKEDTRLFFLRLSNPDIVHLFSYKDICTLVYWCSILYRMKWDQQTSINR